MDRRGFLGWAGLVGVGLLAHHRPGHNGGPTTTTSTTTTLPVPTTTTVASTTTTTLPGVDPYHDVYSELYEVA